MKNVKGFLLSLVAISSLACGLKQEGDGKEDNPFDYELKVGRCTTGAHKFGLDKAVFCLSSSSRGPACAAKKLLRCQSQKTLGLP